ncbi:MAG: tRNA pseudouridine(38-40) synthase TruA [Gammaproteobacteria bacterium]|jgi:tRNA pseudouridine38-40 synthase|nr:tRNA pseudouridine(38-40) synthase TruA [Gammaproteobacteria bacterium]
MARIALGLEYDGTGFVGWQVQRTGRSIQDTIAQAVSVVANETVSILGAGRTDAGVHAACQVAHFDTSAVRTKREWILGINSKLPDDIVVHWANEVDGEFDARRSALLRRYRYLIMERETRSALLRHRTWWLRKKLDNNSMISAASRLLGEHDFSAFRASSCQSYSPIRRLVSVEINRVGDLLHLEFTANAFLQHMVRNLVGVLAEIGSGKASPNWAEEVLNSRDRTKGGVTAPPQGLSLIGVTYPDRYDFSYSIDQSI